MRQKTNKAVVSRDNRYLGVRHVMYCPETRMYLHMSCSGETPDRMWAWSGTPRQSMAAREKFGVDDKYLLFEDGEEKRVV